MTKRRADQLVVDQGLAESRAKAQALILAGLVSADGRRIDKPGTALAEETPLALAGRDHPWVSRGGVKLAFALDHFGIDVEGVTALDIGASTGGFTDVLLAKGAARVHAVDVGRGQFAWRLRQDERVIVHEGVNARHLARARIPEPVDLIVCDASFIGLVTLLPAPLALATDTAGLVALIKPQFEAGPKEVGKGGVVRDPAIHEAVCRRVSQWIGGQPGWRVVGIVESPIQGPAGNREFLLYARREERMISANTAFAGFRPAAFAFFAGLREHNDPLWFKPRKSVYETEVLAPLRHLVVAVGSALEAAGLPLVGDSRRAIFRIYRDVRFSPDKRLYKTHAGAVLTRSGNKRDPGLLYLHVAPGESMVAAGFWHPEPPLLARLRGAIFGDPDGFLAIADRLEACGHPLASDERLSRPPRGFESAKGTAVGDYICWKSFTTHALLGDNEMQSPALVERILGFARLVRPFLEWGWAAIDEEGPPPLVIRAPLRPLPKPDF